MNEIEGTAVEVGTELVPAAAQQPGTLFHTDDPVEVVEKATRVADALKGVLERQGMIARIQGKEHVQVEGWQTLGGMLGVVPVVVWTRRVTDPAGWEAKVEARTLDGRVVGAGEAQCDRKEKRWKDADEYAIRSMAQTRATSKALAAPLRFIVKLAGFSGTPAEEVPGDGFSSDSPIPASAPQRTLINKLCKEKGPTFDQLAVILREIGAETVDLGVANWTEHLTGGREGTASALITWLKEKPLPDVEHPSDVPNEEALFEQPPASDQSGTPWSEDS